MTGPTKIETPFRAGYVAIVGRPNVGKSTLMNAFLEEKLAIVSPKPQTTRHRILGILNGDDHQIIFLDTPGQIKPKYLLQKTMVNTAQSTMKEADLILMIAEATGVKSFDDKLVQTLESYKVGRFLVVNKVDLVSRSSLLPVMDHFQQTGVFDEIIPVSALKSDGLDVLLEEILKAIPFGDPFYPPDMISDEPERFFVSEIIREQIFHLYGDEIPYATSVQIDTFEEHPGRKDLIRAHVIVERDSQKGILIGKGGKALKRVGQAARENIEDFLDRPVFLELHVRVKKQWRKDAKQIRRLGYR